MIGNICQQRCLKILVPVVTMFEFLIPFICTDVELDSSRTIYSTRILLMTQKSSKYC